jgi:hypothetical protein
MRYLIAQGKACASYPHNGRLRFWSKFPRALIKFYWGKINTWWLYGRI